MVAGFVSYFLTMYAQCMLTLGYFAVASNGIHPIREIITMKLIPKSLTLLALLASAVASAEPVMIVQLESSQSGLQIVSQQVREIAYKPSRSSVKAAKRGELHRARAGGWVAQIVRADGSVERELEIEDPRQVRGEFDNHGGKQNERVDAQMESNVFDIQIPVSSEAVTLRIVNRQARVNAVQARSFNPAQAGNGSDEVMQGEFTLKGKHK